MINVKPNRINFNKISKYVLQKTVIQNYNNINETKPKNKYTISQIRRSTSIKPDNKLFYKILESSYYTKCNNLKRPLETQIKNNIVHKSSDAKISKKNPTMNSLNKSEIHSTRNNLNINYSNTSQKNDNKKGSESFSNSTFRPHIKIQKRNNKSTLDHFSSKKNSIDLGNNGFDLDGIHFEVHLKKSHNSKIPSNKMSKQMEKEMNLLTYDFVEENQSIGESKSFENYNDFPNICSGFFQTNFKIEFPQKPENNKNELYSHSNDNGSKNLNNVLKKVNSYVKRDNVNIPLTPITNFSYLTQFQIN